MKLNTTITILTIGSVALAAMHRSRARVGAIGNIDIQVNDQILFDRPGSIVVCRITEVREKAVKVDYELMPVWSGAGGVTVYSYSCFIPISVITHDKYKSLTVKKWFSNKWEGGFRIKRYFISNGEKVFV